MTGVFHQNQPMIALDDYSLIRVSGQDRQSFLQGQLTQDLGRLVPGSWSLAGWTDPKGRLLMLARVFQLDEAIVLMVPTSLAEGIIRRLSMFVLRAKVDISLATDLQAAAQLAAGDAPAPDWPAPPAGWQSLTGPGASCLRLLIGTHGATAGSSDHAAWLLANIRAGIGEIVPETASEFLPQMLNLDLLGAISFDKGCYVGQEIVARVHYRGRVKRRMLHFACRLPCPAPGSHILSTAGKVIGQVVSSAAADASHGELLAVIQLDAYHEVMFLDHAAGRPLQPLTLPYPVPETAAS